MTQLHHASWHRYHSTCSSSHFAPHESSIQALYLLPLFWSSRLSAAGSRLGFAAFRFSGCRFLIVFRHFAFRKLFGSIEIVLGLCGARLAWIGKLTAACGACNPLWGASRGVSGRSAWDLGDAVGHYFRYSFSIDFAVWNILLGRFPIWLRAIRELKLLLRQAFCPLQFLKVWAAAPSMLLEVAPHWHPKLHLLLPALSLLPVVNSTQLSCPVRWVAFEIRIPQESIAPFDFHLRSILCFWDLPWFLFPLANSHADRLLQLCRIEFPIQSLDLCQQHWSFDIDR